jgi:5'-3' exonuclease
VSSFTRLRKGTWETFRKTQLIALGFGLDPVKLSVFATLCGTDYSSRIKNIGPARLFGIFKQIQDRSLEDETVMQRGCHYLSHVLSFSFIRAAIRAQLPSVDAEALAKAIEAISISARRSLNVFLHFDEGAVALIEESVVIEGIIQRHVSQFQDRQRPTDVGYSQGSSTRERHRDPDLNNVELQRRTDRRWTVVKKGASPPIILSPVIFPDINYYSGIRFT